MQLIKIGFFILPFVMFSNIFAAEEVLPNFVSGDYKLKKGKPDQCGGGEFKFLDGGNQVAFGGMHLFSVKPKKEKIPDDINTKDKCVYDTEETLDVIGSTTNLQSKEVYSCLGATVYTETKKVRLTAETVNMDVQQIGKPSYEYNCEWSIALRTVSSKKKSSKK